jgi:hypothetical protein
VNGNTIDFYLSHRRNTKAAKRFLKKLINTDKNPAYGQAIRELKQEGSLASDVSHLQIKYRNNRLEVDHGKLKRLIHPVRGFQSMKTAYATIRGFEIMRMFKKGQFNIWMYGNRTEGHLLMNNLEFTAEIYSEIVFLDRFSFCNGAPISIGICDTPTMYKSNNHNNL